LFVIIGVISVNNCAGEDRLGERECQGRSRVQAGERTTGSCATSPVLDPTVDH